MNNNIEDRTNKRNNIAENWNKISDNYLIFQGVLCTLFFTNNNSNIYTNTSLIVTILSFIFCYVINYIEVIHDDSNKINKIQTFGFNGTFLLNIISMILLLLGVIKILFPIIQIAIPIINLSL